jgi:tungstate transport system substrate-binding protein
MEKDVQVVILAFVISIVFFSAMILVFGGVNKAVIPGPVTNVPLPVVPVTQVVPVAPPGPVMEVRLVTTPDFNNTGLLEYLKPQFDQQYNTDLQVLARETGEAIAIAKRGDADILLLNDPARERAFLEEGYGVNHRTFAINSLFIVGPPDDPARIRGMNASGAFQSLFELGSAEKPGIVFISRGDDSEIHRVELTVWDETAFTPGKPAVSPARWYIDAGKGMMETLAIANGKQAYTLADNASYLGYPGNLTLVPLVSSGELLYNSYSTISVYNTRQPVERVRMANNFTNFMLSPKIQDEIKNYGSGRYGRPLFMPAVGTTIPVPDGYLTNLTSPAIAVKPLKILYPSTNPSVFGKYKKKFEQLFPGTDVQLWPGSNAENSEKVSRYGGYSDLLATTSDYLVWSDLYPDDVTFLVTYAKNGMVIAYTDKSEGAGIINQSNWYNVLEKDGVKYATSDPNEEPVGYRAYMVIELAERYYGDPEIFNRLVSSHSNITEVTYQASYRGRWTINVTDPSADGRKLVIARPGGVSTTRMLDDGRVDYIFTYQSVATREGFKYVALPPEIDLSDPNMSGRYELVRVIRAPETIVVRATSTTVKIPGLADYAETGTGNTNLAEGEDQQANLIPGMNSIDQPYIVRSGSFWIISSNRPRTVIGRPLTYSITMPEDAREREGGTEFISLVIGGQGRAITSSEGQVPIVPALASGYGIPYVLFPKLQIV